MLTKWQLVRDINSKWQELQFSKMANGGGKTSVFCLNQTGHTSLISVRTSIINQRMLCGVLGFCIDRK